LFTRWVPRRRRSIRAHVIAFARIRRFCQLPTAGNRFKGNDPLFAYYFLNSIDFSRHNWGGAQQSLNRNFIYPIPIGVPGPAEQLAIATILSDADEQITALNALIAKKQDIKQSIIQQLLTGESRLPGFNGAVGAAVLRSCVCLS
jgi:type I restriction enzyme S subunit